MMNLLKRWLGIGPPAWYVNAVNGTLRTLNYHFEWDSESPNLCNFEVPFNGQIYSCWVTLIAGEQLMLMAFSNTRKEDLPDNIHARLERRNSRLQSTKWVFNPQKLYVTASVVVEQMHLNWFSSTVQMLVHEASSFDRKLQRRDPPPDTSITLSPRRSK